MTSHSIVPGAHSVMIATAAEANPSCFSPTPLSDVEETLMPAYMRLVCRATIDMCGYY